MTRPLASWWHLRTTCGHIEKRRAVWRAGSAAATWPPSSVRCHTCGKYPAEGPVLFDVAAERWHAKVRVLAASLHVGRRLVITLTFTPRAIGGVRPVDSRP